jgi:hypothetical protein
LGLGSEEVSPESVFSLLALGMLHARIERIKKTRAKDISLLAFIINLLWLA